MSDLSLPTRGRKKKNAMGCCHIIPGQFALRVMLSRSEPCVPIPASLQDTALSMEELEHK